VRNAFLAAAAGALAISIATPAAANGRFPASNQLAFSPSDPNLIVLRTTYGLLFSHDYGTTWTWLCEDVLGLPPVSQEDPSIALTQTNSLVVGIAEGLYVSPDTGCSWSAIGSALTKQDIKDLVVRPDTPDVVLALASTYAPDAGADATAGYETQVFESTDDGKTWSPLGTPIDPSVVVTTIEVAASDPNRIYVSGFRGDAAARTTSLFVSIDKGTTWTERPTPFDYNTEAAVYIGAVDPTNADRVYVRSEGESRLFVTSDAGKTFTVALKLDNNMLGFALSADGSKVYAGSPDQGLWAASTTDLNFQNVLPNLAVQCLRTHGNDLWACSNEPSGFIAGVSNNGGTTFAPKLHLLSIQSPLVCPGDASASACTQTNYADTPPYNPFDGLCTNLGACYVGDGGIPTTPLQEACTEAGVCVTAGPDGGVGDDGGSPAQPPGGGAKSSCGCSAVGGGSAAGVFAAAAMAALTARRRRGSTRAREARR
jgi:MYXO-CTERM domain-containing protein